ncbi:hypothetical protein HDV04_001031 [Boothiomyces sp. JEL0838]|nr:hypothetical protein HDV04_001031 [Boothiomyces sp. JEL0838]
MVGMQKMKKELRNVIIEEAGSCGRILSFDFAKQSAAIQSIDDVTSFFPRLMIYFLCLLFNGKQVDGINFEDVVIFSDVKSFVGKQEKFRMWKNKWIISSTDRMIGEYIRLTNIAFAVDENSECFRTPPVFLLDEIQTLCRSTNIQSQYTAGGVKMHTFLSLLLTELAGIHRPICICTGTNNGEIISITKMSAIIPQVLSLTPLVHDYWRFWTEMTNYYNQGKLKPIQMAGDEELINCLVYASYQIPRLLFIAHQVWFATRQTNSQNREYLIKNYEAEAIEYYKEMATALTNFTVEDLSHIILCCGVHRSIKDESSCVPGTKIKWSFLIQQSLIFPYLDNCYLFPFTLVWREDPDATPTTKDTLKSIKVQVKEYCNQAVKNLDIKDLFLSFDTICRFDLYNLEIYYESLFASSLAVKYYLWKLLATSGDTLAPFSRLYDFRGADSESSKSLLDKFRLDLSGGIFYPSTEAFVDQSLPAAVIHNRVHHNAHHDIILPTQLGYIPVSVKASFTYGSKKIDEQWYVSKTSSEKVEQLIWLYLGSLQKEGKQPNVAFLNGSGVCNGLALDIFILVKNLKRKNNQLE